MTKHYEWQRFTPAQRLARFAVYLGAVMALVASMRTVEIIPEFLYDAPTQIADLFTRMWPKLARNTKTHRPDKVPMDCGMLAKTCMQ